jgi:hypothetical protein
MHDSRELFQYLEQGFEHLLSLDWQENAKTPGAYNAPVASVDSSTKQFIKHLNDTYGYNLKIAELPERGMVYVADPEGYDTGFAQRSNYALATCLTYKTKITVPFDFAKASEALALHGSLQGLYERAGLAQTWDGWSLQGSKHGYVLSKPPKSEYEVIFMLYLHEMVSAERGMIKKGRMDTFGSAVEIYSEWNPEHIGSMLLDPSNTMHHIAATARTSQENNWNLGAMKEDIDNNFKIYYPEAYQDYQGPYQGLN